MESKQIRERSAETIANIAIILIKQCDYLIHRLQVRQERDFVNDGGFRERMAAARRERRGY